LTRGTVALVLATLVLASSCGTNGLNFREDERLEITAPDDRAAVRLPLTIEWKVTDFDVTGPDGAQRDDAGYFGLYVDRAPQPPNHRQTWLVRDDPECRRLPRCPDRAYLDAQYIYATDRTSFTIDRLPQPRSDAPRRREFHEVTIVLLNGAGERIGESAFIRQFEVKRSAL
jgi:hypothetical protein